MKSKKIKLLMKNSTDKQLLTKCLINFGYKISEAFSDEWSAFGMIITDEFYARQFGRNLLLIKNHPHVIYFPIIIMLPETSKNAAFWINAGYDDVLRLPVRKIDLYARLKIFMRLRKQVEAKSQFIFENLHIGIYLMNENKRIVLTNPVFLNITETYTSSQVLNKTLEEMGITFQAEREADINQKIELENVVGYESHWQLNSGKSIYIRESLIAKIQENTKYFIGTIEIIESNKNNL